MAKSEQATPRQYVVLHNGVAQWWQGQTITEEHLAGHDVQRLLDLGAIAPVDSDAYRAADRDGLATVTPEGLPITPGVPVGLPQTPDTAPAGEGS